MVLIVTIVTMMMSKYLQIVEGPLSENIVLKYVIKYFKNCIIIIQVKTLYENKIISN